MNSDDPKYQIDLVPGRPGTGSVKIKKLRGKREVAWIDIPREEIPAFLEQFERARREAQ